MPATTTHLTGEEISRLLRVAEKKSKSLPDSESPFPVGLLTEPPRLAAVLIPLLRVNNAWQVLFTRRTATLAEHSGQVAFPGGRADPEDPSPEATALREANEEIGLDPADVRILGRLNEFLTITNYLVTPVVGVIPWPYPLRLAGDEVSRAFTIPLDWLANPANYEEKQRLLPSPYTPVSVIVYSPYDDEVLWGVSAQFVHSLVSILTVNGTR